MQRSRDEKAVRTSVCLSVKRVNCDKTEERTVQIFIPYEISFSLVFWEEEWLVGALPISHETKTNRQLAVIVYRALHGTAPQYLSDQLRRRSAVETLRPAALVDLQSSWRPPIAACHCRRSLIFSCWPASLEQSTCWRPVCSITCNIPSETENILIPAIIPRRCSVTASP